MRNVRSLVRTPNSPRSLNSMLKQPILSFGSWFGAHRSKRHQMHNRHYLPQTLQSALLNSEVGSPFLSSEIRAPAVEAQRTSLKNSEVIELTPRFIQISEPMEAPEGLKAEATESLESQPDATASYTSLNSLEAPSEAEDAPESEVLSKIENLAAKNKLVKKLLVKAENRPVKSQIQQNDRQIQQKDSEQPVDQETTEPKTQPQQVDNEAQQFDNASKLEELQKRKNELLHNIEEVLLKKHIKDDLELITVDDAQTSRLQKLLGKNLIVVKV
ncbi:unnamed protein product [Bursaphelenchus okinawaensis]|uniref:Uncharacterized protein n=1 Tax=Bursaphelenchus okinawaensis TaxID=465554 RepID=A0A811L3I1_9BILA|nr:unnamed protein product [Bursaphelenchus okinawaensis]CAG9115320.1 unnamed protein product [Bursaphelenchus okinawaensis]